MYTELIVINHVTVYGVCYSILEVQGSLNLVKIKMSKCFAVITPYCTLVTVSKQVSDILLVLCAIPMRQNSGIVRYVKLLMLDDNSS